MLFKKLAEGIIGCIRWKLLENKFNAQKYVFFPEYDDEYNKWGIEMLPYYLRKNKLNKVLVIVTDKSIQRHILAYKNVGINVVCITDKRMRQYMSYYAMIDKSDKWKVVSVRNPYETGTENLLGIRGVTKKDIVYYDIYEFSHEKIAEAR